MASDRLWSNRNGKIVILDSNAIMMCFEFSIDLENELNKILGKNIITIPEPIINELQILSEKGKESKKRIAKPALNLAKKYKIIKLDTDKKGDDAIIFFAQKYSGVVVTNDRDLRKRLKDISIKVIYLRNKQHLVLDS
jgi:rRNA-processing protein FCF1